MPTCGNDFRWVTCGRIMGASQSAVPGRALAVTKHRSAHDGRSG
jgi:hypothetical protein